MSEQSFPLPPVDAFGQGLLPRAQAQILSVASCIAELPDEDQRRLTDLVGEIREIVRIDTHNFVWLSFDAAQASDDFCLLPTEIVCLAPTEEGSNPTFQRTATPPLN